jgi:WD40 repeat protein
MLFVFPLAVFMLAEPAAPPLPPHALHRLQSPRDTGVLALSPDGKLVATAGSSGRIELWNSSDGKHVRSLEGHAGEVRALAFAADSNRLASGGADRSLRLWDVKAGKQLWQIEAHPGQTSALAFAPDGKTIASAGGERIVRVWNAADGKEKMYLDGHRQPVFTILFSADGKTLATGSRDRTVMLWNMDTGKLVHHLKGHKSWVTGLALVPEGPAVISGGRDQTIRFWDGWNGQSYLRLGGWDGEIRGLGIARKGRVLVSGDANGVIRFWQTSTGQEFAHWAGHREGITALATQGDLLATADSEGAVYLWKLSDLPEPKDARVPLSAKELAKIWETLAGDPYEPEVYLAIRRLVFAPDEALPYLKKQLPPVPADESARCATLIKDLNADDFAVRKKAETELLKHGPVAVPMIHEALRGSLPSLEVRRLMEHIIERLPVDELRSQRERETRVIQVLERIGSPQARQALEELAKGGADAPLTRDAKVALDRLRTRNK